MGQIVWTREAERWLQDIHDYVAQDNPRAARETVLGIYERAQVLSRFPELGHRCERHPGRNIRIPLYGHCRIANLVTESGDIEILGVFHGALDIDRYLF